MSLPYYYSTIRAHKGLRYLLNVHHTAGIWEPELPRKDHATMEPRYNEPLYNEVLGITNDFLYPSSSKIHETEPRYNKTLL